MKTFRGRPSSICCLTIVLAVTTVLPQRMGAGDKQLASPGITILDQNGRVAPELPATPTGQTFAVTVAPGGSPSFSPSTVTILVGDTVRWTWAASGHNVRSGTSCGVDNKFCSPTDTNCASAPTSLSGAVYSHTFAQPGTYSYFCSIHCEFGMVGTVNVVGITSVSRATNGTLTIFGQAPPNGSVTIQMSPDLVMKFGNFGSATANASGEFHFDDMMVGSDLKRFYRLTFP